jgi:beta-glucosidase
MNEVRPAFSRRQILQLGAVGGLSLAGLTACSPAAPKPIASPTRLAFPEGYTWGAATSAYQVEGSPTADGRGLSIWDVFTAQPGHVVDGTTGDPAADQFRRWRDDIELMDDLGLGAYRFSISWPRIQPTGSGRVNQKGIDHYRKICDALAAKNIRPAITLYHWDLPYALQDAGGWPLRDTASRFADYATVMFDAFKDLDADWFTINEPKTTAFQGYRDGVHAPGIQDPNLAMAAVHHQLLAHGLAVQAFRAAAATGRIGIALNLMPVYATSPAAKRATSNVDAVENRLFLDPVLLGSYPKDALGTGPGQQLASFAEFAAVQKPGDLDIISSKNDLLAVQYYGVSGVNSTGQEVRIHPTSRATWEQIYPEGLYDLLTRLKRDYPAIPIVITENGMPDPTANLTTDDPYRITYLRDHFVQAHRAIAAGVPLEGHYVWSLLDNFEWAEGYTQRWGIVAVDFSTQKRRKKKSATYFAEVIRANAVTTA